MGNMKLTNILGFCAMIAIGLLTYNACVAPKKAKPCTQCPQYTETIDSMQLRIDTDSVTIGLMEYEYLILWEENQRFSSMLSQIENEPGGHEILTKLWQEYE